MSGKVERRPALTRHREPHPADTLLAQAGEQSPPGETPPAAPGPPVAPAPPPQPETPPQVIKKQVNYRLDPALIDQIKQASIVFSFHQGRQYSQNQIVDLALRDWLERNGPWGR